MSAPELPDSRDELDRLAAAIARQWERREEALAELADLAIARAESDVLWKRWIESAENRERVNRLATAVSLALRVPQELAEFTPGKPAILKERVESALNAVQSGGLIGVLGSLRKAERYADLAARVAAQRRKVDGGELGEAIGEVLKAAAKLREIEPTLRVVVGTAPARPPGRPPVNGARNQAVIDLYNTDPTIQVQGILATLKPKYRTLSAGIVSQILHHARKRGELSRDT